MNDDTPNVEPVELSPTRAELIARVRARGRQIRARRRLAVAGLAVAVVAVVAAPAIAIGTRSGSHSITPATVARAKGDFRMAVVTRVGEIPHFGNPTPCVTSLDGKSCYVLGRTLVTARDVRSDAVAYDSTQGWIVNVVLSPATDRFAAAVGDQVAIIVGDQVVSAPIILPGITGTNVTVAAGLTREQAIAIATTITGRPLVHVGQAPTGLTSKIELPDTTFIAGPDINGTLVIENNTGKAVTLEHDGECHGAWAPALTNASVPPSVAFTQQCSSRRTVFAPGVTRLPFSLPTTYRQCGGTTSGNQPAFPQCLTNHAGPPPLPAGGYDAVVVTSFTNGEFPLPAPVIVELTAAAPPSGSTLGLTLQTGLRGTKVLVPSSGWVDRSGADAGGSGGRSIWNNMRDARQQITVDTGVSVADWWQTDGVKGSINPAKVLYSKAQIRRVNYTTFLYHIDDPADGSIDGVWMAQVINGRPAAYVDVAVRLPIADHVTATTIINRFISDTNVMFGSVKP